MKQLKLMSLLFLFFSSQQIIGMQPSKPQIQTRHFFVDLLQRYEQTKTFDLASKSKAVRDNLREWAAYTQETGIDEIARELNINSEKLKNIIKWLQVKLHEFDAVDLQKSAQPQSPTTAQPLPAAAQPAQVKIPEQVFLFNPQDPLIVRHKQMKNGVLLQLNTVSQFDPKLACYGYATCPVNAVRNGFLMQTYANTGRSIKNEIIDVNNAITFMERLRKCTQSLEWFDDDAVQNIIKQSHGQLKVNPDQISVISSVLALLDKASPQQKEIEKIRKGLLQPNYSHSIIVGTLDDDYYAHRNYHYFALTIIKKGPETQYIVADTAHEPGNPIRGRDHTSGFDNRRLNYLIDMIREGRSPINIDKEAQESAKRGILSP